MLKIVSLGTSNAISAIAFAIKQWGRKQNLSIYRIFKKPGKALSEEDVDNLKNCDAYLVDGTWGSTSPQRQKYKTVDIQKDQDGKIIDFKRFAWMEYINLQANLLSKKYNKPLTNEADYVFLGAWNFKQEIFKKERKYISKGGKFIIHVPVPKII